MWRKSLTREASEPHTSVGRVRREKKKRLSLVSLSLFSLFPDLLFDCSSVLEYAEIRTVLQSKTKSTLSAGSLRTIVGLVVLPITVAIYRNGEEKPAIRWSFEMGIEAKVKRCCLISFFGLEQCLWSIVPRTA